MQTLVAHVKNFFGFEFGFERFTDQALRVLNFARQEAVRSQSSQVQPEHLLAGLLAAPDSASARLLRAIGATSAIEINEDSFEFRENLEFSSQSKFVLELALQIVRLQGQLSIGTEHLLWGLMRLTETNRVTFTDLLQRYEIDTEALNEQLVDAI